MGKISVLFFCRSLCSREILEMKMYIGFQVGVPLEVVHLTDEYWRNVVSAFTITIVSITSLEILMILVHSINLV